MTKKYICFPTALILILLGCKQVENNSLTEFGKPQTIGVEDETFNLLLKRSKLENKNLFLVFTFQGCSICRIFENYHKDTIVNKILRRYFIIEKIDYYKTPGGRELYVSYGKTGFPSWTILDSAKTVIIDSGNLKDRTGNIGFPDSEIDREYYLKAVQKAAPHLTKLESDILYQKLKEYRPDRKE
jgi:hypothetical protein